MGNWDNLSLTEKAAMMRVAVKNGITNLQDIKREYNEFAKGGPKKKAISGWYQQHQNRWYNFLKNKGLSDADSARLSGFFTAQDDLESAGGKSNAAREKNNFGGMQRGGKNIKYNTVEDYMQDKWKMMNSKFKSALGAKNIDEYATILGNPETAGKGYLYYVTDKVKYDPKSPQWKAAQRQHMQNYINGMRSRAGMGTVRFNNQPIASAKTSITPTTPITPINPSISQESLESPIPFTPFNPEAFFATPDTYQQPVVVEEPEIQEPVAISPYNPEEIERQERMNRLSAFNRILSLTNPYPQEEDSFLSTVGLLTGNTFSKGGKIHIKPSHRGRLTELKKRTGKSEAELYKTGGPAVRKMITFARNARKWKHGLGGNLFDGTTENSQQMTRPNIFQRPDGSYFYSTDGIETDVTPINVLGDNPALWTYTDSSGKIYRPAQIPSTNYTLTEAEDINPLERAANNYFRELDWRSKNDPSSIALQGKYTMPLVLSPLLGKGAAVALANPYVDAALTSYFGAHGLNHAINEGIDGYGDAAMTALELAPLGRLARPLWNAGKEGLQYAVKAADNTVRYAFPSYDLYRTIGETTPRTTPTYHGFRLNGEQAYTGSPLFEFGQTMGTSPEKAYFMRAPKDVDVLKLGNGKFRHEVVGNEVLPSGEVNGKFVSYGEPWQEFALGDNSALYEFPVGPRRGPSLMATDWKGRGQKYSVDEAYDYMQQEEALRKELASIEETMGDDFLKQYSTIRRNLINEKYPALKEHIDTSIYGANQTVIPNERWNFDKFLKTPFWKYSENPTSGQVQKELMMRWPEAKPLETPTIEWADAARTPQITAENAASIQYQIEQNVPSGSLEETAKSVEKGRNTLLDWIRSPFYKARLEDEPLYRVADDVVADAGKMIEEVPVDISKTKLELDPSGRINGVTKTRPAIQTQLPDGTTIVDLNTGLDVNVASDLGKDADETTLHELLHYMTANSKGTLISKAGEKIIEKGWMNPTETHFDAINIIHKNRSKGWQDYILDQNNALLPQYDSIVKMVMEEPNKAISFLEKAGKNTQDAQKVIQSLRSRYSTWYDIQEQRAYLQQLFHSKIRPNIKNPNDATEIEEYLSSHPEILENFPAYKHIQEVRPGSLKDYAKYFSAALGTIPFIFKTPSKDE